MPSPIAHTAIAFLTWPALQRDRSASIAGWRRWALMLLILFTLVAPDFDIAVAILIGAEAFKYHGGPSHSLLAGFAWSWIFAAIARWLVKGMFWRCWLVGLAAYWSHVFMDALTDGRGVMMFWPATTSVRLPEGYYLFIGVEHSNWADWQHHLLTIGNELIFAGVIAWIATRIWRKRSTDANIDSNQTVLRGATRS